MCGGGVGKKKKKRRERRERRKREEEGRHKKVRRWRKEKEEVEKLNGRRSEINCPEFTKRMEYLLRFVIEGQYGQSSLASELAASTNGRYICSGWYVQMLTVGIT